MRVLFLEQNKKFLRVFPDFSQFSCELFLEKNFLFTKKTFKNEKIKLSTESKKPRENSTEFLCWSFLLISTPLASIEEEFIFSPRRNAEF